MNPLETQNQEIIKIVTKSDQIEVPKKATSGSAGYDLRADIEEPITLEPGALTKVPTGIFISLPSPEYVALLFARSGLAAKHGIALTNGVGVIDSDYRGEIMVLLCNLSKVSYTINPQERIAQMIVMPISNLATLKVASLDETLRNDGGFGSTGK